MYFSHTQNGKADSVWLCELSCPQARSSLERGISFGNQAKPGVCIKEKGARKSHRIHTWLPALCLSEYCRSTKRWVGTREGSRLGLGWRVSGMEICFSHQAGHFQNLTGLQFTVLSWMSPSSALLVHTDNANGELQERLTESQDSSGLDKAITLLSKRKRAPIRALRSQTRFLKYCSTKRVFLRGCYLTFLCTEYYSLFSWFLYFKILYVIG